MRKRYTTADLSVLTREEARRFVPRGDGDPQLDLTLAWELLYRLEPEVYDRLVSAERLHPGIVLVNDIDLRHCSSLRRQPANVRPIGGATKE